MAEADTVDLLIFGRLRCRFALESASLWMFGSAACWRTPPDKTQNSSQATVWGIPLRSCCTDEVVAWVLQNSRQVTVVSIEGGRIMLWAVAVVLVVLWLLGFVVLHVTSAVIHLLLILALIVLVYHFLVGNRTRRPV